MGKQEIYEKLHAIMLDVFDLDTLELTAETTAQDVDGWDSLSNVRLVLALEEAFGLRFNAFEIGSSNNVGEFVDLLESKLS
ncbi:MAG: phosphopantetheine-binding protein [Pseudomonadota bacterium]